MKTPILSSSTKRRIALTTRQLTLAMAACGAFALLCASGYFYYRTNSPGQLGARAYLALEQQDAARAIEYLQKALAKNPTGELGMGLRNMMARALLESSPIREVEARNYLNKTLAEKPDHPDALDLLAKSYVLPATRKVRDAVKPISAASAEEIIKTIQQNLAELEKPPATPVKALNITAQAELHRLHYLVLTDQVQQASSQVDSAFLSQNPEAMTQGKQQVERLKGPAAEQRTLALGRLREALQADPKNAHAAGLMMQYEYQDRHYAEAMTVYEQFQKAGELNEDLAITAARSLIADAARQPNRLTRFADAEQVLRSYLKAHPASARVAVSLGDVLLDQDQIPEAVKLGEQAVAQLPGDLAAQVLLINVRLREHKNDEALRLLTPLTTSHSNRPEVWYLLGMAHDGAGHLKDAEGAFRKAIAVNPSYVAARQALLTHEIRAGNRESAAQIASEVLREDRFNMPAWTVTVEGLVRQGQSDRARQLLISLANDSDLTPEATPDLVRLLAINGAGDAAGKLLKTLPAGDKSTLALRGYVAAAEGNTAESRQLIAQALAADPKDFDLRLHYADLLENADLSADVRAQLDEAAAQQPLTAEQSLELARRYLAIRLPERAQAALKPVIAATSDHAEAQSLSRKAQSMLAGGGAAVDPSAANLLNAPVPEIVRHASTLLRQKKYQESLTAARGGLARDKANVALHQIAALSLAGLNQTDQAVEEVVEAARAQPEAVAGFATFVEIFSSPQNAMKGMGYGSRVESINPALGAWAMGRLAQLSGDLDLALRHYNRALAATARLVDPRPAKDALYQSILEIQAQRRDAPALRAAADTLASGDEAFAPGIRLLASDHLLGLADRSGAEQQLEAVAAKVTPTSRPALVLGIASRWLALGRRDRAVGLMEKQTAASNNKPELLEAYATLLTQAREFDKALEVRRRLTAMDAGNPAYRVALGQTQAASGDSAGAMRSFDEATALGATGKELAGAARVQLMIAMGLLHEAAESLKDRSAQSEDSGTNLAVAKAWAELGKAEEARKWAEAVPEYAAEYAEARVVLARIEMDAGRNEKAIALLHDLVDKLPPGEAAATVAPELFIADIRAGKTADALVLASRQRSAFIANSPMWQKWTTYQATAAREGGQFEQGIALLNELDVSARKSAALDLALMQILQNKREAAATSIANLTDTAPEFARTTLGILAGAPPPPPAQELSEKISAMLSKGLPSAVLAALSGMTPDERAAVQPDVLTANHNIFAGDIQKVLQETRDIPNANILTQLALAQRLLEAGWSTSTLNLLAEVNKAAPDLSMAAVQRHQALTALRRFTEADTLRDQLTQQLKNDPNAAPSMRVLFAASWARQERYADALAVLEPLAALERTEILTTLATLHEKQGELEQAIALHRRVRQIDPENIAAANNLAYTLAAAHPTDKAALTEARGAIDFAISKAPQVAALQDTLGYIEILSGNAESGTRRIARVLPSLRLEPAVHYHLGLGYSKWTDAGPQGRELARLHLENVKELAGARGKVLEVPLATQLLLTLAAN